MTLEEKIEQVKNFRPIDDTFFEVMADDIGVCQEMLRIILEDEKLIVKDVIVKYASDLICDSEFYKKISKTANPYGDGTASKRTVDAILYHFGYLKERPEDLKVD